MTREGNTKLRARELGIPFEGVTGLLNSITDVKGLEVGYSTIISGSGPGKPGHGPVRTGVTAILPRGREREFVENPVFASWFSLNGYGEMTGTTWIDESGFLYGPVVITNTYSIGVAHQSIIEWAIQNDFKSISLSLPVVAETYDGYLNDIQGFHVKKEHVFAALNNTHGGRIEEGNVGGGTGMVCHEFKGGSGTSSRIVKHRKLGSYILGTFVQANHGRRELLQIAGVPVGKEISEDSIYAKKKEDGGSIIIVLATDAPLLPHQLKRIAKRASMGLARSGSISASHSGDLFIAFSTSNEIVEDDRKSVSIAQVKMFPNEELDVFYKATVEAVDEAIINTLVAAENMVGFDNHKVVALPHDRLREVMKKYNRLVN